jgi:hypothetical protein
MLPTTGAIQIKRGGKPYYTINHGDLSEKNPPSIALMAIAYNTICESSMPIPSDGLH